MLDTTVLSNFAHAGRPDLVRQALGRLAATTPSVMAELAVGERARKVPICDWTWLPILVLTDPERQRAALLRARLGPGEGECLAVAQERGGVLVSDDRAAARLARERGVPAPGTIGLLIRLVDAGAVTVDEADAHLRAMASHGYYSPVSSLAELRSAGPG